MFNSRTNQFGVSGVVLAVLAILLITSCDSCSPSQGNLAIIGHWDIPGGETYTLTHPSPIPGQEVDFIARVYYPANDPDYEIGDDPTGIDVSDGEHPLIVFGHGQYGVGRPNNYLGADSLLMHLASWGYICISVNLDVVHGGWSAFDYGIPHRGEMMLEAVDRMLVFNGDAGSLFHNKIDENTICLIGHSRGGGGAISASNQNMAAGSPREIKGLGTISPVDFGTDALQPAIPHISLYGSWDGDLERGNGPRIWDAGTRAAPKQFVEIYGANHFHFTDEEVYVGELSEISRAAHHNLAQGFFTGFFDVHVLGNDRFDWPLYLNGSKKIVSGVDYFIQELSPDFASIDKGDPLGTASTNNMTGMNVSASLALFQDHLLTDLNEHFYNTSEGLLAHWDDSGDELVFNFPVFNAVAFSMLSVRLSQRPLDFPLLNPIDTRKDFTIRLRDNSGNMAIVNLKDYLGGLQYPDQSGSPLNFPESNYKSIPRTYRIPLADFTGVNPVELTQVSFLFNKPNEPGFVNISGAIAIEDLEFSN